MPRRPSARAQEERNKVREVSEAVEYTLRACDVVGARVDDDKVIIGSKIVRGCSDSVLGKVERLLLRGYNVEVKEDGTFFVSKDDTRVKRAGRVKHVPRRISGKLCVESVRPIGINKPVHIFNADNPGKPVQDSTVLLKLVNAIGKSWDLGLQKDLTIQKFVIPLDDKYEAFFEVVAGKNNLSYLTCSLSMAHAEADNLQRHFGTLKLTLQQDEFGTFWPSASEMPEFTALSADIQNAYKVLTEHCSPHGNYIGFDCATNQVCVFQHHFTTISEALPSDMFSPFEVVRVSANPSAPELGELTDEQQRKLIRVMEKYHMQLMAPNVTYMHASGILAAGRKETSIPCIRVTVWAKGKIPLGSWLLPKELDGVPIDVVEGFPVGPLRRDIKSIRLTKKLNSQDQICSGSGIFNASGHQGTLGGVVEKHGSINVLFGLTNGHVLNGIGTDVHSFEATRIGTVTDNIEPFHFSLLSAPTPATVHDPPNDVKVDCGLFVLDQGVQAATVLHDEMHVSWTALNLPGPCPRLQGVRAGKYLDHATKVYKQGATSGLTAGITARGWAQLQPDVRHRDHVHIAIDNKYYVCHCQCILIIPKSDSLFSEPGDSGSLVFIKDNDASDIGLVVGLLFSGTEYTFWERVKNMFSQNRTILVSLACFIEDVETVLCVSLKF